MNFRRILFFGIWLALGVVGIGIVLPELNRSRSASDQRQVFENIASELPAVATSAPNDSEALSDFLGSPTGATSGNSTDSLGLSGVGQGGGGTTTGLGIGSIGAGASASAGAAQPGDNTDAVSSGDWPAGMPRGGGGQGLIGYGRAQGIGGGSGSGRKSSSAPGEGRILGSSHSPSNDDLSGAAPPAEEPAADPASETEALMDALDRKLASLPLANIAFNTPETIPLGDVVMIELLLSLKETEEQLREAIREAGPVDSARIQITDQMEARLTGLGFRIEAITPERQAVSRSQRTGWRWQIEPSKSDMLKLNLTLSAIVTVDGVPAPRTVQIFEREIYVEVPLATQVTQFAKNNVEVITTFLLVPVVGGIYRYARKKKRRGPPPDLDIRPRRAA